MAVDDPRIQAAAEALARLRSRRRLGQDFDDLNVAAQRAAVMASLIDASEIVAVIDAVSRFPLPACERRG